MSRELVPQALADRADRVQAGRRARFGERRHRRRNVIRYLPIWTSSSSSSTLLSMRRLLTKVPLRLPRSRIVKTLPSRVSSACRRETVTSSRKTSHSGERPISGAVADRLEALPRPTAARADDERRPVDVLGQAAPPRSPPGRGSASSRRRSRGRAAHRSGSSTSPPRGSGIRTPGSRCGSLPPAEDRAEIAGVDVLAAARPLCPLGADDVDLAVHHAPVQRDVVLLVLEPRGSQPRAPRRPCSARSGSGVELGVVRHVARALVDRALERRRRLRLEASVGDLRLAGARCARPRRMSIRPWRTPAPARDRILAVLDLREQGRQLVRRRAKAGREAFPRLPFRSGAAVFEAAA